MKIIFEAKHEICIVFHDFFKNIGDIFISFILMFIPLCSVDNVGAVTHELLCGCHWQSHNNSS